MSNKFQEIKMKKTDNSKSNNWLKSINEKRLNELKLDKAKYLKELSDDYVEVGGSGRTKKQIINDYDTEIDKRKNKFDNGGLIKEGDLVISNYVDFYKITKIGDGYFEVSKLNNENKITSVSNIPFDFSKQSVYKRADEEDVDLFYYNLNLDKFDNGGNVEDWKNEVINAIDKVGYDYALAGDYSNWENITDSKFIELRKMYVMQYNNFKNYINFHLKVDKSEIESAIDKEGFDYALTNYNDWKDLNDSVFSAIRLDYIIARNNLSKYLGYGDIINENGLLTDDEDVLNTNEDLLNDKESISDKDRVIDLLINGKIHSAILKEIIGREPNYPCEYIDDVVLQKLLLVDYYQIKK